MKSATSTEGRKKRAALYRKTAQFIEQRGQGACCYSLSKCGARGNEHMNFAAFFKPQNCGPYWWGVPSWEPNYHGPRILALCFMAAMVEAGDA